MALNWKKTTQDYLQQSREKKFKHSHTLKAGLIDVLYAYTEVFSICSHSDLKIEWFHASFWIKKMNGKIDVRFVYRQG